MRGRKVQRDMEVVRTILRAVQNKKDLSLKQMKFDGVDDLTASRHLELLIEAGYVDGLASETIGSPDPTVFVKDLTWDGHEFAGALLSDETIWDKVKAAVGPEKLVSLPLKVIQDLATKALTSWATQKMGL
jgi:hypothetical protein